MEELSDAPLASPGFSGSRHSVVQVRGPDGSKSTFVLKRTVLAKDWTCSLSGAGRSREAALLSSDELGDIWAIFSCPYLGFAEEPGEAGFLMEDLTPFLLPDVREPLSEAAETLLLGSLGDLHARFWHDESVAFPWLASPADYLSVLGPDRLLDAHTALPTDLGKAVASGWQTALKNVSPEVAALLRAPAGELEGLWRGLPHTIVHGDVKVANFAIMPNARLSAFDWAMMGWAPASVDLGWYLAVNAARLSGPKEDVATSYRHALEERIAYRFADPLWDRLERFAVTVGARMLLWSKANALESGRAGADEEWEWWVDRLEALS